jgi:hypothetical protein
MALPFSSLFYAPDHRKYQAANKLFQVGKKPPLVEVASVESLSAARLSAACS